PKARAQNYDREKTERSNASPAIRQCEASGALDLQFKRTKSRPHFYLVRPLPNLLVHRDRYRLRSNSVGHHFQKTTACLRGCWNIEVGRDSRPTSCNSHRTVPMGPGVEHMARRVVGDPDQRIVGSRFELVTE